MHKNPTYAMLVFGLICLACSTLQPSRAALSLTSSPSPIAILLPATATPTPTNTSTALPTNTATAAVVSPTPGSPPPTPIVQDSRTALAEMIGELAVILSETPSATPTPEKRVRCDCNQKYTCEEFFKQVQAQQCFDDCGGWIEYNWSLLDEKDRDGIVCENLP